MIAGYLCVALEATEGMGAIITDNLLPVDSALPTPTQVQLMESFKAVRIHVLKLGGTHSSTTKTRV